jgi:hypothetical protein
MQSPNNNDCIEIKIIFRCTARRCSRVQLRSSPHTSSLWETNTSHHGKEALVTERHYELASTNSIVFYINKSYF